MIKQIVIDIESVEGQAIAKITQVFDDDNRLEVQLAEEDAVQVQWTHGTASGCTTTTIITVGDPEEDE